MTGKGFYSTGDEAVREEGDTGRSRVGDQAGGRIEVVIDVWFSWRHCRCFPPLTSSDAMD